MTSYIFKDIRTYLILGLIIVLVLLQFKSCTSTPPSGPTVITKIDTVWKHVDVKVPVYVPKYITRIRVDTVEIPSNVDTLAILKDYFAKYRVTDTLRLVYSKDDRRVFGYGIVIDTISQNKILSREIEWKYEIPTIEKTTTIYPASKRQLFVGFNAGFTTTQFVNSVSAGLLYKNKRDNIYQIMIGGANTASGLTPTISGGMFWKIQLRKPKLTDLSKIVQ